MPRKGLPCWTFVAPVPRARQKLSQGKYCLVCPVLRHHLRPYVVRILRPSVNTQHHFTVSEIPGAALLHPRQWIEEQLIRWPRLCRCQVAPLQQHPQVSAARSTRTKQSRYICRRMFSRKAEPRTCAPIKGQGREGKLAAQTAWAMLGSPVCTCDDTTLLLQKPNRLHDSKMDQPRYLQTARDTESILPDQG